MGEPRAGSQKTLGVSTADELRLCSQHKLPATSASAPTPCCPAWGSDICLHTTLGEGVGSEAHLDPSLAQPPGWGLPSGFSGFTRRCRTREDVWPPRHPHLPANALMRRDGLVPQVLVEVHSWDQSWAWLVAPNPEQLKGGA